MMLRLLRLSRVRVKLGIGGRSRVGVGVKLVGWWGLRAGIENNNMTLFEVLYESMKVLKVDTAACIVAALIDRLATGYTR